MEKEPIKNFYGAFNHFFLSHRVLHIYVNCGLHVNFWKFYLMPLCVMIKKIILSKSCITLSLTNRRLHLLCVTVLVKYGIFTEMIVTVMFLFARKQTFDL